MPQDSDCVSVCTTFDLKMKSRLDPTLLSLKKPTSIDKMMRSIPIPHEAVPENGLPKWYTLCLEQKLPVPKIPSGIVTFSRGPVGYNLHRHYSCHAPQSFSLRDPLYRSNFEYSPFHDPHLAKFFAGKRTLDRMKHLGLVTEDGRAVCTLKEFNQYRKLLYDQFMDQVHVEMKKLDELAKDDMILRRTYADFARRKRGCLKAEFEKKRHDKIHQIKSDQLEETKRLAKERQEKAARRLRQLVEIKEQKQKERKRRAQANKVLHDQHRAMAAEVELQRKIVLVKQWRINEERRLHEVNRAKRDNAKRKEEEISAKWETRVQSQAKKINEEAFLLNIYSDKIAQRAKKRMKQAEISAYKTDLNRQTIRLANLKITRGESKKLDAFAKRIGFEFEKTMRGIQGLSKEMVYGLAEEEFLKAQSIKADRLVNLSQARHWMEQRVNSPDTPLHALEHILNETILEFCRRRVNKMVLGIEHVVVNRFSPIFFSSIRPTRVQPPCQRLSVFKPFPQDTTTVKCSPKAEWCSVRFGEVKVSLTDLGENAQLKDVKERPPTRMPSNENLLDVLWLDKVDELPGPIGLGSYMPERRKLLETLTQAKNLLHRLVPPLVEKRMDHILGEVTLPHYRFRMERGEAIEIITKAVIEDRIHSDGRDTHRVAVYLTYRILASLAAKMKAEKKKMKQKSSSE